MRFDLSVMKIVGVIIALVGLIILLCSLPGWLWTAVLGLALIAGGLFLFLGRRC